MAITQDDFKKIWASTSSVPEYSFSDSDYQDGWEFVGNLPPTRAMWDTLQRRNDQKMKYLQDNGSMCFGSVADMVATDLEAGQTTFTQGYYSAYDGGSATYRIRTKDVADVENGGSIIFLDNGNVAELIGDGTYHAKQWGVIADGVTPCNDMLNSLITHIISTEDNGILVMDKGEYALSVYLSALRSNDINNPVDARNLTIKGEGSVLIGASDTPFDVLQLNNCQNLNVENLEITSNAVIGADTEHGANGISVTNNSQNIHITNVYVHDLPAIVNTSPNGIDGGKAFTVQTGGHTIDNIIIQNCKSKGTKVGFELDATFENYASNIIIRNCHLVSEYAGVTISYAYSSDIIDSDNASVSVIGNIIEGSQIPINLGRGQNVNVIDNQIVSYSPDGGVSYDTVANAIRLASCRNCNIIDNIVLGAYADIISCILLNSIANKNITISNNVFRGTSSTGNLLNDNAGGLINSYFIGNKDGTGATITGTTYRIDFYNVIDDGVSLSHTDVWASKFGVRSDNSNYLVPYNFAEVLSGGIAVYQTASSSPNQNAFLVCDNTKTIKFGIRNNGTIITLANSGAVTGSQNKNIPIYDSAGTLIGKIPVYS